MKREDNREDLERIDAAWNKLEPLLDTPEKSIFKLKPHLVRTIATAAALLIITTVGLLIFKSNNDIQNFSTKYGETLKVVLPDSSTVYLNGNSSLSYSKSNFDTKNSREVKVDGEAYFSVKHTKNHQKFFVRMADNLSVEVLGTEFNITKRDKNTRVVLNSGKIDFHMDNLKKGDGVVSMKPGDLIEYENKNQSFKKEKVDPIYYSSWKSNRIIFSKTKLVDVIQNLNDTYGLKISVKDEEMLDMRVSGSAPTQNINDLINALSETFNIDFVKHGDSILLEHKKIK
jgi:transmembrane sensor